MNYGVPTAKAVVPPSLSNNLRNSSLLYLEMADQKRFTFEEAKAIGEQLGIDWSKFGVEQFRIGMDVELEHGLRDSNTNVTNDDSLLTGKIALAHLNEYSDYYSRLLRLEKEAEVFWGNK